MKAALSALALIAAVAFAQERCDAPYPNVYCNTTEIVAFESYDCKPYHVFIARGSDEPYPGRQGNITREICSRIGRNDCSYENIEYPARSTAWGKDEWCKSASKGQANGQAQMKGYTEQCPNAKLILLGFSQGAAVAQDILGGGGGKVFECEQPISQALDSATSSKVIAAVTFGAVIRSRNQKYTIGEGANFDGQRARTQTQLQALNKFSDRLRDYCHNGDPMCAVGSTPVDVYNHLDYFLQHNEEVVSWVAQKAKSSGQSVSESNTAPRPSPSPSHSIPPPSTTATPGRSSILPQSSPPSPSSRASTSPLKSVSAQTNILPQSSSPTSAIAKSAAATPSIVASATLSSTNTLEAQPAQTGSTGNTNNANTGAASALMVSPFAVLAAAAVFFAI